MKHRIFIAINLPENIKRKLFDHQEKIDEMFAFADSSPVRWTKKENLHITLFFLGYVADQEILDVCRIVKEAAQKNEPFSLNLNKISYGPPGKKPRMIWVAGEKSKELGKLQRDLECSLLQRKISVTAKESRPYSTHITLGRLKQWQFKNIEPEERPEISEDISLNFEVQSIEIMESKLKPAGPDYLILESMELGSPPH